MLTTLTFFTRSSSLPGLTIKPGAWVAPPSTVRCVCGLLAPLLRDANLRAILLTMGRGQMATKLAMSLGLGNDVVSQASSERERTLLRSTWSSVVQLQQIAASRA